MTNNFEVDGPSSTSTACPPIIFIIIIAAVSFVLFFRLAGTVVTATPRMPSTSQRGQSCGRAVPGSCPPDLRGAPRPPNKTHTKEILATGSGPAACPPATCCFACRSRRKRRRRRKCLPHPILRVRTLPATAAFSQTATHSLRCPGSSGCFVFLLKAEEY